MFHFYRTKYDITYPLSVIYINKTLVEHEEINVIIQADASDETVNLYGLSGSMRFMVGSTEYSAPLQGSDFLSAKTGSLFLFISDNLPFGLYRAYLRGIKPLAGVCGRGLLGYTQGGNVLQCVEEHSVVLQVQSLPEDWRTGIISTAQQYAVDTIVRP